MAAAKRDVSGVFDVELNSSARRKGKAAALDSTFNLSHNGVTFVSETRVPEWTEVGVEMRLPVKGAKKDQSINCRGVVVQCEQRQQGKGFSVALMFLDLHKRDQALLSVPPAALSPSSVSIAR